MRNPLKVGLRFIGETASKIRGRSANADKKAQEYYRIALDKFHDAKDFGREVIQSGVDWVSSLELLRDHIRIPEGDNAQGSTPWRRKIKRDFNDDRIAAVLNHKGLENYSQENVVEFLDKNTDYWEITEERADLEDLKYFGVPDAIYPDEKRFLSSIGHKDLMRKELRRLVFQGMPIGKREKNKVTSFMIFVFNNADLLLGKLENQRKFYRKLVKVAVSKSEVLPLVLMQEVAGISPRDTFENDSDFERLERKVKDPEIKALLKGYSLDKTFPQALKNQ